LKTKITGIKTFPMWIPLKESHPLSAYPKRRSIHILVEITTDEGISGYGEAIPYTYGAIEGYLEQQLKPLLIGEDPTQIERLWNKLYHISFGHGAMGISINALSSIEIALWDILGKKRKLPVYEMLGGLAKSRVKAYASLMEYKKPEEVAKISQRWVDEGYTGIKIHQGKDDRVICTKAVRDAVGDDVDVMLDVNGAWTPWQELKAIRQLEKYNLTWLEEPIWPIHDYSSLAWLRTKTDIPIAGGENEFTVHGFKKIVEAHPYDLIQPDVIMTGGISSMKKIFALAEGWNIDFATHSFFFGPDIPASVHLSLSNVRNEWVEINAVPLESYFIQPAYRPEKGWLTDPDKPGLGFDVDWDVVNKYLVK